MTLLVAMLPLYLVGNFHCLGMCGPIAMLLGSSPYRLYYLLGRLTSFTLAGAIAGALGEVIQLSLGNLSGALSIALGVIMILAAFLLAKGINLPFSQSFAKALAPLHTKFQSLLLLKEPWPLFMFGFLTIMLPCGQTLLVYSACAISGSLASGIINGFAFGILTTPSLYLAMYARSWVPKAKQWYQTIVICSALIIGVIAVLRGLADWGMINHLSIHPLVLY